MQQDTSVAERAGAVRRVVAGQVWLLNVVLGALVASTYWSRAPSPSSVPMGLFLYFGVVASAACVTLLPGVLTLVCAWLVRPVGARALVSAALWTLALGALFVDTRIYAIFRYHFNGMVWNVLTTPGADEAVHLSSTDLVAGGVGLGLLFAFELVAFRRLSRREAQRHERGALAHWATRPLRASLVFLLPCLLVTGGLGAWADLVRDRRVLSLTAVYPVYPKFTIKRIAERWFGYRMKDRASVDVDLEGLLLRYPIEMPRVPENGPRPNILVIVIDSLRSDMLVAETMPFTTELAQRARVFEDHLSGGNATRFGLFSLIYGLHGSYWHPFYREFRSPVLVDALLEQGYVMRVITSASMSFPEFRSTAWVRIEDSVEERVRGERLGGRDDGVVKRFDEWLRERAGDEAPFFSLLLLDAPHQSYAFPEEFAKFQPSADDVSYLALSREPTGEGLQALVNRYKNSVLYSDDSVERILGSLRDSGEYDDTLIAITGDHGEEFFENGFFGHTSNFTREQLQVPFLLLGPGVEPGVETRPTSHIDFAPTVIELLGADPAVRAQWTLGENLLDPPAERARVAGSWDDLCLILDDALIHVSLAAYGGTGIDVYDQRWQLVADDGPILERAGRRLALLALECRRFMR